MCLEIQSKLHQYPFLNHHKFRSNYYQKIRQVFRRLNTSIIFFFNAFEIYKIQIGIELHVDIVDNAVFIYLLSSIQLDAILIWWKNAKKIAMDKVWLQLHSVSFYCMITFSFYILYTCKNFKRSKINNYIINQMFKRSKINNYIINQMFKFQVFIV